MNIELEITLRCNAKCLNCNKFCNMEDLGIIYDDSMDMTISDIEDFILKVQDIKNVHNLRIMGGEPTMHDKYEEICLLLKKELVDTKVVNKAHVITNGLIVREGCIDTKIQQTYSSKPKTHTCALVSPTDLNHKFRALPCPTPVFWGVAYNKLGWYPCGPGGAIARLFKMDHMRKDIITKTEEWGDSIIDVCRHCQNYSTKILFERDHGRLITDSYKSAIENYAKD